MRCFPRASETARVFPAAAGVCNFLHGERTAKRKRILISIHEPGTENLFSFGMGIA